MQHLSQIHDDRARLKPLKDPKKLVPRTDTMLSARANTHDTRSCVSMGHKDPTPLQSCLRPRHGNASKQYTSEESPPGSRAHPCPHPTRARHRPRKETCRQATAVSGCLPPSIPHAHVNHAVRQRGEAPDRPGVISTYRSSTRTSKTPYQDAPQRSYRMELHASTPFMKLENYATSCRLTPADMIKRWNMQIMQVMMTPMRETHLYDTGMPCS